MRYKDFGRHDHRPGRGERQHNFLPMVRRCLPDGQTARRTSSASDELLTFAQFLRERACLRLECSCDHMPVTARTPIGGPPPHAIGRPPLAKPLRKTQDQKRNTGLTALALSPAIGTFARATGEVAGNAIRRTLSFSRRSVESACNDGAAPGDRLCRWCRTRRKTPRLKPKQNRPLL